MQISRIKKITDYRIFKNFAWPQELSSFSRFNLIYGWNGAGKTTLSNLFHCLEKASTPSEGEFTFEIDGNRTVTHGDIRAVVLPPVRVFNRNTVDRNVFEVVGKELPPVFYLGEDSVEKQKKIELLKAEHDKIGSELASHEKQLKELGNGFEKFCSDQARPIKTTLTSPGGGPYNNYNISGYKATAEALLKSSDTSRLSVEDRQSLTVTINSSPLPKLPQPSRSYPDFFDIQRRVSAVLARSVVSTVLDELRDNPSIAQWVSDGLRLHKNASQRNTCHFCKQEITDSRIAELEGHFNNAYSLFQSELATLSAEVQSYLNLMEDPQLPDKAALYPALTTDYDKAVIKCKQQSLLVRSYLQSLKEALAAKRLEPFTNLSLSAHLLKTNLPSEVGQSNFETFIGLVQTAGAAIAAHIGKSSFDEACYLIRQHNELSDTFEQQVANARIRLERDAVAESLNEYSEKKSAIETCQIEINGHKDKLIELRKTILEIENTIRSHAPAADELTKDMAAYLGRNELSFEARETGYTITRNGKPALNLSEGERTGIAFMYFLKSLSDTSFDIKKGVVVIDDPISSLDANSIYAAFGFMRSRIEDAGQVFILTHNFTFFRQVKNWFNYIGGGNKVKSDALDKAKDIRFYMLKASLQNEVRQSSLQPLDRLLHQFESEYHHLFQTVLDSSKLPSDKPLHEFYALPNSARRLLEAVLAFKQPARTGELFQQLKHIEYDEAKKARIIRFTNTYSHHGLIAEPEHDLSILSEAPSVLIDVLGLIEKIDPEHFASMQALCGVAQEKEQSAA